MKAKLKEMLKNEQIKDSILSKAKTTQIMFTALYQNCQTIGNNDIFARACERLDDVFDYILEQMCDEQAE